MKNDNTTITNPIGRNPTVDVALIKRIAIRRQREQLAAIRLERARSQGLRAPRRIAYISFL